MRPELGTGAPDYVFENNNQALAAALKQEIKSAIARFEPRAAVSNVTVELKEESTIVNVEYVVLTTGAGGSVPIPLGPSGPSSP
jgi:phage baseplate assembly protein W